MIGERFTLALGGGGGRGWAHIGVAQALDEAGLRPRLIVGTSMGSVIGAGLAAGFPPREIERIVREAHVAQLFGRRARLAIFDPSPALSVVTRELDNALIEDLPIPFAVATYDLVAGRPAAITSGPVVEALERSIAVPFYFPPRPDGEHLWCDAGLWEAVPVTLARQLSPDPVIGVYVQAPKPRFFARPPVAWSLRWMARWFNGTDAPAPPGPRPSARAYMGLLSARLAEPTVEEAPELLIVPRLGATPPWQLSRLRLMVELGYRDARLALSGAGLLPEGGSGHLAGGSAHRAA